MVNLAIQSDKRFGLSLVAIKLLTIQSGVATRATNRRVALPFLRKKLLLRVGRSKRRKVFIMKKLALI